MPSQLDGNPDRASWPQILAEYFGKIFAAQESDQQRTVLSLRHLEAKTRESREFLRCCPNELRDLAFDLKPHKAGGEDGICTNMLKYLPYAAFSLLSEEL